MTATQMLELLNRTPFVPLEIRLVDGTGIRVDSLTQISTSPKSSVCVVFDDCERMRIISYQSMTEVVTTPVIPS